ncbi:MAG: hypothetical protein JKY94_00910 [Rhodobacteraceae bacterium]|nr:hypothetical protein [Paracoccaceae bacterium]
MSFDPTRPFSVMRPAGEPHQGFDPARPFSVIEPEAQAVVAPEPEQGDIGFIEGVGNSFGRGVQNLQDATLIELANQFNKTERLTGIGPTDNLGDFVTSGLAQNEIDRQALPLSHAAQEQIAEIQSQDGVFSTIGSVFSNPTGAANLLAESGPAMIPSLGAAIIGGVVGGPLGAAAGTGLVSSEVERTSSFSSGLQERIAADQKEEGIAPADALRRAIEEDEFVDDLNTSSALRGLGVGLGEGASMGLAGKLFGPVRNLVGKAAPGVAGRVAGVAAGTVAEGVSQAVGGGGGEALAQIFSEGEITDPNAIGIEAALEPFTGPIDAAINTRAEVQRARAEKVEAGNAKALAEAAAAETEAKPAPETPTTEPVAPEPTPAAETRTVKTPDNQQEIQVTEEIVEASDLVSSSDTTFPQELQPRDRTRQASEAQIADIASGLDPQRLLDSPTTDTGAPIIAASGDPNGNVVESGNGRVEAIRQAYQRGLADSYRATIEERGFDVAAFKEPILVRRRAPISSDERTSLIKRSNERGTLGLSAVEQADTDASALGGVALENYQGGELNAAANALFVRDFVERVVPVSERAGMVGPDGRPSQDGVRRIQGAILSKAFGEGNSVVGRILESTDDNVRAITGALLDNAGQFGRLRDDIKAGRVSSDVDIAPDILDALDLISHARETGENVADVLAQDQLFDEDAVSLNTASIIEGFHNSTMTRARSRKAISDFLKFIVDEARKARVDTGNLFSDAVPPDASDILDIARGRQDGEQTGQLDLDEATTNEQVEDTDTSEGAKKNRSGTQQPELDEGVADTGPKDSGSAVERNTAEATTSSDSATDADPAAEGIILDTLPGTQKQPGPTLYSNPLGPLFYSLFGSQKEINLAMKNAKDMGSDIAKAVKGQKVNPIATGIRYLFFSFDGNMRAMNSKIQSTAYTGVLDRIFTSAGNADGVSRTYDEASTQEFNQQHTLLAKALEPVIQETGKISGATSAAIIKLVQNPNNILPNGPSIHKTAAALKKILDDRLIYMRDAGMKIGDVEEGYWHREFDMDVVAAGPDKFVQQAARAFLASNKLMRPKTAQKASENLLNELLFGGVTTPGNNRGPASNFVKSRSWNKAADTIMAEFHIKDVEATMSKYIMGSTKRAEIARRFGDNWNEWPEIVQNIRDEGGKELIDPLTKYVLTATGTPQHNLSRGKVKFLGGLRTITTLGVMEKATLASIAEVFVPVLRTGNAVDALRSLKNMTKILYNMSRGKEDALIAMAQDFGAIGDIGSSSLMAARFAGGEPVGKISAKVEAQYFRRIYLEQFTNATRASSMAIGSVFLNRVAHDFQKGNHGKAFFLAELGVSNAEMVSFSDWVISLNGRTPSIDEITTAGRNGSLYQAAITRFVDQTVMRPSVSTKPEWASHPLGAVVFQLQSFLFTFQKNVLLRTARVARDMAQGKITKGEGAKLLAAQALIGYPLIYATQLAIGEMRDELFSDPERRKRETTGLKLEKAWSRSGYFGAFDIAYNLLSGARYQRAPSEVLSGPAVGGLMDALGAGISFFVQNAETTNTAERKAMREVYDFVIEPMANLALTALPVSKATKFATVVALPAMREDFVDNTAGKASTRRSSQPIEGLFERMFDG